MENKKDTVVRGGLSVTVARMLGMACSFLLFIVLARHSSVDAGLFRSVLTYIVISEFLGILGLHRWLAVEMAATGPRQWPLFVATTTFTIGVCTVLTLIYLGISLSHVYSKDLSFALQLGALAVIPSGIYACVQSALIGIGFSHPMGMLNMTENLFRSVIAIALLYFGYSVFSIVMVFVLTRWLIALIGIYLLSKHFEQKKWKPTLSDIKNVARQSPKFALIMLAFLTVKNAGMVMLPALVNEAEAATYAVAYQMYDLALLIPSVLALTSNNFFAEKAAKSKAALRWAAMQLSAITSTLLFPFIAMGILFSTDLIHFLFGNRYENSSLVLKILLVAVVVSIIDQVLSQIMVSSKRYDNDRTSITVGAYCVIVLTLLLTPALGASGTAIALTLATGTTVAVRFYLLREVFSVKLMLLSINKQFFAALLSGLLMLAILSKYGIDEFPDPHFMWILMALLGILFYWLTLYAINGLSNGKRSRMKKFMLSR